MSFFVKAGGHRLEVARTQVEAICGQVHGSCERLILPLCGHAPHRDCPDAVLEAMARFVARLHAR